MSSWGGPGFTSSRSRRSKNFAQIPNDLLRDSELSARARGVLCYLLSHSDTFTVTRKMLLAAFPEGRDAIETALRELREAGYVRVVRPKGESGRFEGSNYLVFEERGEAWADPETGESAPAERETTSRENHVPDNPHAYIRTPFLKNTSSLEDQEHHGEKGELLVSEKFAEFWSAYPKKVGKRAAERRFREALKRASHEEIMAGVRRYADAVRAAGTEPRHVKNPEGWLNADRWADEVQAAAPDLSPADRALAAMGSADSFDWSQGAISQ